MLEEEVFVRGVLSPSLARRGGVPLLARLDGFSWFLPGCAPLPRPPAPSISSRLCLKFNWPFVPPNSEWAQATSTNSQPRALIPLYLICPAEFGAFITYPNTPTPPLLRSYILFYLWSCLCTGRGEAVQAMEVIYFTIRRKLFLLPPPHVLDGYGDWLLFVPARLILNTALFLLLSHSEDFFFFPTLKKCWGSIPVAQGRRALNCCAVAKAWCDRDLPIIVITGIDKLIPTASFRAPNYTLNQTSAIVSTFCRLTFRPLHLDSPLIPRLPLRSLRASAPCH